MQQRRDVDRLLAMWSEDAYPPPAPPYLSKVLERTRRTKQRRAWASLERWLPMSVTTDRQAAPGALRLAWILLIVLALVVAAAGIAVVGARLFAPSTGIPQGGAAVLALASLEGSNGEVGDVYTFNADGTGLRQLTGQVAGAVTSGAGIESATSWSPDGRRIAFRNWYNGNDLIEVMDAGGSNRQVLATRPQTDKDCADRSEPAWSPDGRTILYAASDSCDGPHTIYAVPSDGSAPPLDGFGLGNERHVPDVLAGRHPDRVRGQRSRRPTGPVRGRCRPGGRARRRSPRPQGRPRGPQPVLEQPAAVVAGRDGDRDPHGNGPDRDERHRHRQGRRVWPARPGIRQGLQPELVARRHARRVPAHRGPIGTIHRPAMHDAHLGHQCGRLRGATARPPDRRLRLRTAVVTRRDAAAGEPHRRQRVPCRRRERRRRRAAGDPPRRRRVLAAGRLRRCLRPRRSAPRRLPDRGPPGTDDPGPCRGRRLSAGPRPGVYRG